MAPARAEIPTQEHLDALAAEIGTSQEKGELASPRISRKVLVSQSAWAEKEARSPLEEELLRRKDIVLGPSGIEPLSNKSRASQDDPKTEKIADQDTET